MLFDNSDASPDVLSQELRLNTALESVRDVTVPERVEIGGGIKSGAVYGLGKVMVVLALGPRRTPATLENMLGLGPARTKLLEQGQRLGGQDYVAWPCFTSANSPYALV